MSYFMLYFPPPTHTAHEAHSHGHDGTVYRLFKQDPGEVPESAWWLERRFRHVGDFDARWNHVLGGITAANWVEAERWVRHVLGEEYLGSSECKATVELPCWFDPAEESSA
jgi:hypothetical protein